MDEKKRGLDDLLTDLGIGENEAAPEVVLKQDSATVAPVAGGFPSPSDDTPRGALEHFMVGLLLRLDPAYSMDIKQEDDTFHVEVLGGDLGRIIGKEGRTLQAAEFLTNVALAKQFGSTYRASLDAAGYRRRAEERVRRMAQDAVLQVEVSGEPVDLPPMRPSERRIIHVMLKQHEKVTTTSVGQGEDRHIVVLPRSMAGEYGEGEQ
jgi:spoIIIJ-associated protein